VSFGQFRKKVLPTQVVFVMLFMLITPLFFFHGTTLAAGGQVTSRLIQMSDDTTNTSGGTASYLVSFSPYSTKTIYGVIVDFCNTDPIPGDVCTAPTGFSAGSGGFTAVSGVSGSWTGATANTGRTFELTLAGGAAWTPSTVVSFAITGAVNPTLAGTFYARIFTFSAFSGAGSAAQWLTTTNGSDNTNYWDYGGIALAITQPIIVTSKVQEQISFCVYITSCGTQAVINLGDAHDVLSTSAPFVDNTTTYSLTTNASHGAVVYMKGPTLTSGSNTIPAAGATPFLYNTTGTDFFGVCSYNTSGEVPTVATDYVGTSNGGACSATVTDTGGTAVLTSLGTPYATFGFNTTNTTSTYGDLLATLVNPGATLNQVALGAGVNFTQPSGVYTSTIQLIATGTY
jgi:hypothetical protein